MQAACRAAPAGGCWGLGAGVAMGWSQPHCLLPLSSQYRYQMVLISPNHCVHEGQDGVFSERFRICFLNTVTYSPARFTPYVCLCWWRYYTFNCMCLHCISRTSVQTTDSQPVCQRLPAVSCSLSLGIVVDGIPSWSSPAAGGSYFLLFPPWLLLSSGAWRKPRSHPPLPSPEAPPSARGKGEEASCVSICLVSTATCTGAGLHFPATPPPGLTGPLVRPNWQPGPLKECS